MTVPIVCIVGNSGSGKTTVATALIHHFSAKGLQVAAVKHCPHGHSAGSGGSDTERMLSAGALLSIAASPGRTTTTRVTQDDEGLAEIVARLGDGFDVVVAEGFKKSTASKVLVAGGPEPPEVSNVVALVGSPAGGCSAPRFAASQMDGLASHLETVLGIAPCATPGVSLVVDGIPVYLGPYPSRAIAAAVRALVGTLKGVPAGPGDIVIRVPRQDHT